MLEKETGIPSCPKCRSPGIRTSTNSNFSMQLHGVCRLKVACQCNHIEGQKYRFCILHFPLSHPGRVVHVRLGKHIRKRYVCDLGGFRPIGGIFVPAGPTSRCWTAARTSSRPFRGKLTSAASKRSVASIPTMVQDLRSYIQHETWPEHCDYARQCPSSG